MVHRGFIRFLAAGAVVGTLAAGPASASVVGFSHATALTVTAQPPEASNGVPAAYVVTVTNNGTKPFAHVGLAARTPSGSTFVESSPSQGTCVGGVFACDLGALAPGAHASVVVVYRTPSTGSSMTIRVVEAAVGSWTADGQTESATTTLVNDPSFVGLWIPPGGDRHVETDQTLSPANPQSTALDAPADSIPVSLSEQNIGGDYPCPTLPGGATCVTQWSFVNVNGGATYPQGFPVTLSVLKSSLPPGLLDQDDVGTYADDLHIVHVLDNGTVELISAEDGQQCAVGDGGVPSNLPCVIETQNDTSVTAVVWVTSNGHIGGY